MTEQAQPLVACHHCGNVYGGQELERGETASCTRCGSVLWRYSSLGVHHWLALVITAFIVFCAANVYPVADMAVQGMTRSATLLDSIAVTWQQNHEVVAVMSALSGFVFPLMQLGLLLWVLLPLSLNFRPWGFAIAMRLLGVVKPWCMVPVFLLGVLVSVVKLAGMARVAPGLGLFAFAFLTVLLTMFSRLPPSSLWRHAERRGIVPTHVPVLSEDQALVGCHVCGQVQAVDGEESDEALHHCVRCNAVVHQRKPHHVARTWALMIAAIVCYFPANLLPVMRIQTLLGTTEHTILGGVIELWKSDSFDIAIIVFVASVVVPMFKLLALGVLVIGVQRESTHKLRARTRLYEVVEFIGQWSMLDVFVVILLAALANFNGLMQISAGTGAAAFGAVVIFTMLAAMSFDPRRSWDHVDDLDEEPAARSTYRLARMPASSAS
ncbi:MAG: PqiA/YebS family transporter subunit [Burkholderiaceae bacterium]|nr:PqiA/YebS family transporter subunit [Burkholderiaceae bacterium]